MPPPPHSESPRRIAAVLCLTAVFAAEIGSLRPGELKGRAGALVAFAGMPPEDALLGGSGFAFARRLGPFLRGVSRRTPPTATIAVSYGSDEGDLATFASAYVLAPRRVVPAARIGDADFAATFRKLPGESVGGPVGLPASVDEGTNVPFGELARLR